MLITSLKLFQEYKCRPPSHRQVTYVSMCIYVLFGKAKYMGLVSYISNEGRPALSNFMSHLSLCPPEKKPK